MNDVTLYGHIIYDTIYNNGIVTETVGGIANCWEELKKNAPTLNVKLHPLYTGESVIVTLPNSAKRTSKTLFNSYKHPYYIEKDSTIVAHIAYLDKISSLDLNLKDTKAEFITADVCSSVFKDKALLSNIDLLFISEEDYNCNEFTTFRPKFICVHNPTGGYLIDRNRCILHNVTNRVVSNINVLGAGDIFASQVIKSIVNHIKNENKPIDGKMLSSFIITAHSDMLKILTAENEKV